MPPPSDGDPTRAVAELLAGVSHELRTPMHAILSYARLGEDKAGELPAARLQQYFHAIRGSGERLLALLNDLLDLARMEAGRMSYRFGPHELAPVLQEAEDDMQALAAARGLTLELAGADEAGRAWCDPVRLGQVLRNLLANAIRFSPSGHLVRLAVEPAELRAGRRESDTGTVPGVVISVRDAGPGIAETELESIFDKFVQGSAGAASGSGAGLGLAICREIVTAHAGRIWAENAPGGGAILRIELPRAAPRAGAPRAPV